MDDRGRLAQSLTGIARWRPRASARADRPAARATDIHTGLRYAQWLDRCASLLARRLPPRLGVIATLIFLLAAVAYGSVKGDHVAAVTVAVKDARDWAANVAGLRVVSVAVTGNQHVTREEVHAIAGVSGATSLVFLDVEQARDRLKHNPWIGDATVLKLYPGELQISVKERAAFALWQKGGAVSVIADDGTVLEPYVAPRMLRLPLLVGAGAEGKAKELLDLLGRYPSLRELVRASVLVGERRWNLRLHNGIEVRLPESGAAAALARLIALDAEKKLFTRDVVIIDLRLPDRVTVRLSDAAAQARIEALKDKQKKKAGGVG
jgi:cell division protein FtsQ